MNILRDPRESRVVCAVVAVMLLWAAPASSQETAKQTDGTSFEQTASKADHDLQSALEDLAALRQSIAGEKLPLTRQLTQLENRLIDVRAQYQDQSRTLDTRNLDLNNLRTEIQSRQDEKSYVSSLLDEYIRNFETRVHIAELQRYQDALQRARLAPENPDLDPSQVFGAQTDMVQVSIDRLLELVGGTSFEGTAVGPDGLVKQVDFALVGPVAVYAAADGSSAGMAEQRLGSLEPNMMPFDQPQQVAQTQALLRNGAGEMPFDATLGSARKVEAARESIEEHVIKGGPVMVPILLLALTALIASVLKWFQLARVRRPSPRRVEAVLEAVRAKSYEAARELARKVSGPTGEMLRDALAHVGEPKELVEEVMFERTLETRLRLQSFLAFIAVTAAAAPLLGLLGTVTGIINTFKLITVFGTGDAKTLSSGISEALITTEFGLIVAIPSLLLHAYLSRKARRVVDGMEKVAVSFLNRVPVGGKSAESAEAIADQVMEILRQRVLGQDDASRAAEPRAVPWNLVGQLDRQPEH